MDRTPSLESMTLGIAAAGPRGNVGFREFVAMVAAMMALMGLGIDMMLPALPQIGSSLGVTVENDRQWIITSFVLGFGVAMIIYGPLSDRFGRKGLILGGMAGYVACCIGIVFAPNFAALLVLRALQGASIAATRVVATSMVRDCYGGRQMARVMSLAMMIFLAVPILAPSIGQGIMLVFPWQGLFLALAAFGTFVFVWVALRLPETLHPEYRRGIAFMNVLSGMRTALGNRQASGYMIVQALLQGAMLGFISSIAQVFDKVFHALKLMPLVFGLTAASMGIAALLNSRFVERLGTRRLGHSAIVGMTATQIVHVLLLIGGVETIWTFALFQSIAMFCFGLTMGNFSAIAMEPLAALAGTAASVQGFVSMVAGSLIGAVIGQQFDGTTLPVTAGFVATGSISILVILFTERGRMFHRQIAA